jgi:DtxR family Mn-dependent transcriptional regulator
MLPSSTVENYLKAIVLQQQRATGDALVAMGQIASALGVTPGTATTMVKALAESGLVQYEPYSGVRLTGAGERLAGLVLRRHRLVELFLVQVMGLRWDEVHDEAEKLEHVVSERLIERMDEMLGRPQVDPHGDPIPDADGAIRKRELQTLLDCPLDTPVTVTRVTDQGAPFLRFIEDSHLKPGAARHHWHPRRVEAPRRGAASRVVDARGHAAFSAVAGHRRTFQIFAPGPAGTLASAK